MPLPVTQDEYIPWGTLRYLIGEAMYGGRVSDSFDRRILTTYLDEYLGDFLFDTFQPFHFYVGKGVDYLIPAMGPHENYTAAIDALSPITNPRLKAALRQVLCRIFGPAGVVGATGELPHRIKPKETP